MIFLFSFRAKLRGVNLRWMFSSSYTALTMPVVMLNICLFNQDLSKPTDRGSDLACRRAIPCTSCLCMMPAKDINEAFERSATRSTAISSKLKLHRSSTMGACATGSSHKHMKGRHGGLTTAPHLGQTPARRKMLWSGSSRCPLCFVYKAKAKHRSANNKGIGRSFRVFAAM